METATAAASAAGRSSADNRLWAGRRLRELAANLILHRGFAEVVASLKPSMAGRSAEFEGSPALAEQSFKQLIARDARMGRYVAEDCGKCADT
jgi:hypothetical protein